VTPDEIVSPVSAHALGMADDRWARLGRGSLSASARTPGRHTRSGLTGQVIALASGQSAHADRKLTHRRYPSSGGSPRTVRRTIAEHQARAAPRSPAHSGLCRPALASSGHPLMRKRGRGRDRTPASTLPGRSAGAARGNRRRPAVAGRRSHLPTSGSTKLSHGLDAPGTSAGAEEGAGTAGKLASVATGRALALARSTAPAPSPSAASTTW
jgi:hypothetical protein